MQRYIITKGATSQIILVSIYDSSSTTGGKLTGLVYNSAGLTAYYYREGAGTGATAITLATATLGTYTSGGFIVVDGTNMPGDYELHLPSGVTASGADRVLIQLKGATNMVPVNIEIDLINVDLRDGVRGGMTALPNANAGAAGGLPTDSAGKTSFNDIAATAIVSSGAITTSGGAVSTVTSSGLSAAAVDLIWDEPIAGHLTAGTAGLSEALGSAALVDSTITGTPTTTAFTFTGGSTSNNFYKDQLVYILSGTGIGQVRPILSSSYSGGTTTITVDEAFIVTPAAADRFAVLVSHVHPLSQIADSIWDEATSGHVTAGSTGVALTDALADTNELQTDWVNGGRLDLIVDAILVDTAEIGVAGAGLTNISLPNQTMNITGNLSGSVGSVIGHTPQTADHTANIAAILTDTGTTIPALIAALNDPTVAEILTTAMTEAYAAKGSAPTLAQILFEMRALLAEKSIASTTLTAKKLDSTTTAATYTLDDATNPTSITRTT